MTANEMLQNTNVTDSYTLYNKLAAQFLVDTNRGHAVYKTQYVSNNSLWELNGETFYVKFNENRIPSVGK